MPIFEYRCSACDHKEELLQKHSDPAPAECPQCGKAGTMAKELSASAFHLKGGGWYKDLYSSSTGASSTGSSSTGASSTGSSSTGSSSTGSSASSGSASTSAASSGTTSGSSST